MKLTLGFLWVSMGVMASNQAHAVQASTQFRTALKNLINNYPGGATGVFNRLTGDGFGSCNVSHFNTQTHDCRNYFVSSTYTYNINGVVYRGLPVYQNDTADSTLSNAQRYSSYSRVKMSDDQISNGQTAYASTGCFSGSGGLWINPSRCWGGNNNDECGLSQEEYAKKILIRMVDDPEDPCSFASMETSLASDSNFSSSLSATSLMAAGKIALDAQRNCYLQTATNTYSRIGTAGSRRCSFMKARAPMAGYSLPLVSSNGVIVPPVGSATYISFTQNQTTTKLSGFNLNYSVEFVQAPKAPVGQTD